MAKLWNILTDHFSIERVPMLFLILVTILGFFCGSLISCIVYGVMSLSATKLFILCILGGYGSVIAFLFAIFYEYRHVTGNQ